MIDNLVLGFSTALSVENLAWCFVGVLTGTVIGILPGLGSTTGVAVLLPLTLSLEPVTGLIMLAGIYYGAQYGGTITSVLISTPGEASTVVTTIDGYPMARRGRAGAALSISAIGSFVAAIISLALLVALAPPFAQFALRFGPPEMMAVMILAFATIVSFAGDNKLLGFTMASLGIVIACVGVDAGTGVARYTFGQVELFSGIPFVEVMIGLFAVGEVLYQVRDGAVAPIRASFRDLMLTPEELRRSRGAITRGSFLGFLLGCLPGAGSTLASFMAYGVEKRVSKHKDEFGSGAIEGVAAPESANNAAANANFIPTLTLGIPGGATTAVLLGAFLVYGIQPGPLLFEQQPELVWGLLASFFIGNVILLVLNLPLAPVFAQILRVPYGYMYPLILFTSFVGFLLGCLPGAGSTLASFMAYGVEKRVSKHKDEFGSGAIEGVAAPESANNAAANANFIPTLTLGIPGGATTAVLLGAFLVYGIQPGPLLFEQQPELVWGLLASFFIGNVILLVLNLPLAPVFAQILRVPYGYMYPLILFTSFVGAYSIQNNMFSVWVVLVSGLAGYAMKRLDFPMAPLVLGLVIGALFEKSLLQTSALGDGNLLYVFMRPLSLSILILAVLLVVAPSIVARLLRSRSSSSTRPDISSER